MSGARPPFDPELLPDLLERTAQWVPLRPESLQEQRVSAEHLPGSDPST